MLFFSTYTIVSRRLESLEYLGIDVALNQLADLAPGTCAVERTEPSCTIQNCRRRVCLVTPRALEKKC